MDLVICVFVSSALGREHRSWAGTSTCSSAHSSTWRGVASLWHTSLDGDAHMVEE